LGETINEFSSDGTMGGNSNQAVPTEAAVRTYVDNKIATSVVANTISYSNTVSGLATSNVQTAIDLTSKTARDGANAAAGAANAVGDTVLSATYSNTNLTLDANGFVTFYQDSLIRISNTTYTISANSYALTNWKETFISSNVSYTYTATYAANGMINTITRA
jgi:hypothetical protein